MTTEGTQENAAALQHEMAETREQLVRDLEELRARLRPIAVLRAHPRWLLGLGILFASAAALGVSLLLRRR